MFTVRYLNNTENPAIGSLWVSTEDGYQLYLDRIDLTDTKAIDEVVAQTKAELVMQQEKKTFQDALVASVAEKFNT